MRLCPHRIGEQVDFATTDDHNSLWPQTTWDAVEGSFPLASSSGHALGSSGGAEAHTLVTDELPSHTHGSKSLIGHFYMRPINSGMDYGGATGIMSATRPGGTFGNSMVTTASTQKYWDYSVDATHEHDSVGGGSSFSLLPPYATVNRWKRVA